MTHSRAFILLSGSRGFSLLRNSFSFAVSSKSLGVVPAALIGLVSPYCRSGALFCAGENQFRQCGVAGAKNVRTMRRAEDLCGERIARAAARRDEERRTDGRAFAEEDGARVNA